MSCMTWHPIQGSTTRIATAMVTSTNKRIDEEVSVWHELSVKEPQFPVINLSYKGRNLSAMEFKLTGE